MNTASKGRQITSNPVAGAAVILGLLPHLPCCFNASLTAHSRSKKDCCWGGIPVVQQFECRSHPRLTQLPQCDVYCAGLYLWGLVGSARSPRSHPHSIKGFNCSAARLLPVHMRVTDSAGLSSGTQQTAGWLRISRGSSGEAFYSLRRLL